MVLLASILEVEEKRVAGKKSSDQGRVSPTKI